MTYFSGGRLPHGLLVYFLFLAASGWTQSRPSGPLLLHGMIPSPCQATTEKPTPAFPTVNLNCGRRLDYLGVYNANGLFHPISRHTTWSKQQAAAQVVSTAPRGLRPAEVPPSISLHPLERVVQDFHPSYHAVQKLQGQSRLSALIGHLVTFAYGREWALLRPAGITTDSRGRVIVCDRGANAIHVLDGEKSFRIVAGPNHRLVKPNGVAVDGDDNIYVSDSETGLVTVYDPDGRFLRHIGKLSNETIFEWPAGIAVDRANGRLYVVDMTRGRLFILNLQGRIIDRVGVRHGGASSVVLDHPTEVVVNNGRVAVLDAAGSRVQVMDGSGRLLSRFDIAVRDFNGAHERGISLDLNGNVYVTNLMNAAVRVYSDSGRLIDSFGMPGTGAGQFLSPGGLWIDTANRIYISDTGNRRVQVFQLTEARTSDDNSAASDALMAGMK